MKCFEEKCKCQAFQILGNRCELLDEDRFSAPDDFVNEAEYAYFDMSREYVHQVWGLFIFVREKYKEFIQRKVV